MQHIVIHSILDLTSSSHLTGERGLRAQEGHVQRGRAPRGDPGHEGLRHRRPRNGKLQLGVSKSRLLLQNTFQLLFQL